VPLEHPAQVAGRGRPQHHGAGAWPAEQAGDLPHRVKQPAAVHAGEQFGYLPNGTGVEFGRRGMSRAGERDVLAAGVGDRALPADQPIRLEAGQHPAQVPGVDVEHAAQVGHRGDVLPRQFEQQPRLGQGVRHVQVHAVHQPDHVGVEPVELADPRDLVRESFVGDGGHGRLQDAAYLPKSTIILDLGKQQAPRRGWSPTSRRPCRRPTDSRSAA